MLKRSDLYNYQEHGVEWTKPRRNNAKWIDCGLGKTVIEATAFAEEQDAMRAHKMLVIAPKRIARKVWSDEVQEWDHLKHLRVSRIVGSADECFDAMRQDADVYTIGRERVPWLHAQFIQNDKQVTVWPWDWVTVDEAQSFSSSGSQRFKALYDLRLKTKFPRLSELSGTPLTNGYMKLWSQVKLLDNGKILGSSARAMQERWFTPPVGMFAKWNLKPGAAKDIQSKLKDFVLALREEDYLQLPPVVDNIIRCELSTAAMATYKKFEREFIGEVAGKRLSAANAGVLDGKLLQLANGAVYYDEKKWVPFHDAKLEALDETLESISGKALVCYGFNHDKARICARVDKLAKTENRSWRILNSDRDFSDWAAGTIDWGLLHPASAGHGLNDVYKSGCEDMIWFGLTNNHEFHKQARKRLEGGHRRMGRAVKFHYIVADGTRDDDYVRLLKRKAFDEGDLMAALAYRAGERLAA